MLTLLDKDSDLRSDAGISGVLPRTRPLPHRQALQECRCTSSRSDCRSARKFCFCQARRAPSTRSVRPCRSAASSRSPIPEAEPDVIAEQMETLPSKADLAALSRNRRRPGGVAPARLDLLYVSAGRPVRRSVGECAACPRIKAAVAGKPAALAGLKRRTTKSVSVGRKANRDHRGRPDRQRISLVAGEAAGLCGEAPRRRPRSPSPLP